MGLSDEAVERFRLVGYREAASEDAEGQSQEPQVRPGVQGPDLAYSPPSCKRPP